MSISNNGIKSSAHSASHISRDRFLETLGGHAAFLKDECTGRRAYFWEVDLRVYDMSHLSLERAAMAGCNLAGNDLAHTRLDGANLDYADLTGSHLHRSSLTGALIRGVVFKDAILEAVDLTNADASPSKYIAGRVTNFAGAVITASNFSGADLSHADFTGAHLTGVQLTGANITGARFDNATLQNVKVGNMLVSGDFALLKDALAYEARLFPHRPKLIRDDSYTLIKKLAK